MLAVVFPFDLFGSAGTGAGAQLLGDALQEMLDDAHAETVAARAEAFRDRLRIDEVSFDTMHDLKSWRANASQLATGGLKEEAPLIWLAGNHLAVLPIYEALGPKSLVVQFDAHLDVYNLADNTSELSHGNFLMHAKGKLPTIAQVGSRDLFLPEDHAKKYFSCLASAEKVVCEPDTVLREVTKLADGTERIWIDIDCDVFDPAYFPAVQHAQPFGLSPATVLKFLASIWSEKVVGISLSEFDPGRDRNDQSLGTLIWLLEWCLLKWSER